MSSYIPATPPRSHRKHKRSSSIPYATPKTPFARHHDLSLDYKISSKTNMLKTPSSSTTNREFTVYQTPITPKSTSTTKKNKNDIIITPPSNGSQYHDPAQFNSRSLFPPNPSRIGSGRSHHKQNLKAPSLTTLLTLAAVSSSSEAELSDTESGGPKTPRKQLFTQPSAAPPPLPHKDDDDEIDFSATTTRKKINPFVDNEEEVKKELVYVDKYGRKKIEKLTDEEASLLQKTKRKLNFN